MFGVQRPAEVVQQNAFGFLLLEIGEVFPFLGLSCLDERNHIGRKQGADRVERLPVAFLVPACRSQVVFDGGLKCVFGVLAWHQTASLRTSILTVTAAEIRAVRYSRNNSMDFSTFSISESIRAVSRSRKAAM